jgi:L-lactate permease
MYFDSYNSNEGSHNSGRGRDSHEKRIFFQKYKAALTVTKSSYNLLRNVHFTVGNLCRKAKVTMFWLPIQIYIGLLGFVTGPAVINWTPTTGTLTFLIFFISLKQNLSLESKYIHANKFPSITQYSYLHVSTSVWMIALLNGKLLHKYSPNDMPTRYSNPLYSPQTFHTKIDN